MSHIAIIGAQSTGKTTLAKYLSEHTRLPLITEGARVIANILGINRDSADTPMAVREVWQIGILTHQLVEESRREKGFVSDRSVLDNFAYIDILREDGGFAAMDDVLVYLEILCRDAVRKYGSIIYLPLPECAPAADGFRRIDPEYQERVDRKIWELAKRWDVHGEIVAVPSGLSWSEKYRSVKDILASVFGGEDGAY